MDSLCQTEPASSVRIPSQRVLLRITIIQYPTFAGRRVPRAPRAPAAGQHAYPAVWVNIRPPLVMVVVKYASMERILIQRGHLSVRVVKWGKFRTRTCVSVTTTFWMVINAVYATGCILLSVVLIFMNGVTMIILGIVSITTDLFTIVSKKKFTSTGLKIIGTLGMKLEVTQRYSDGF